MWLNTVSVVDLKGGSDIYAIKFSIHDGVKQRFTWYFTAVQELSKNQSELSRKSVVWPGQSCPIILCSQGDSKGNHGSPWSKRFGVILRTDELFLLICCGLADWMEYIKFSDCVCLWTRIVRASGRFKFVCYSCVERAIPGAFQQVGRVTVIVLRWPYPRRKDLPTDISSAVNLEAGKLSVKTDKFEVASSVCSWSEISSRSILRRNVSEILKPFHLQLYWDTSERFNIYAFEVTSFLQHFIFED